MPDNVTVLLERQLSGLRQACHELQGQLEAAEAENQDLRQQLSDCHQQHLPVKQASAFLFAWYTRKDCLLGLMFDTTRTYTSCCMQDQQPSPALTVGCTHACV